MHQSYWSKYADQKGLKRNWKTGIGGAYKGAFGSRRGNQRKTIRQQNVTALLLVLANIPVGIGNLIVWKRAVDLELKRRVKSQIGEKVRQIAMAAAPEGFDADALAQLMMYKMGLEDELPEEIGLNDESRESFLWRWQQFTDNNPEVEKALAQIDLDQLESIMKWQQGQLRVSREL